MAVMAEKLICPDCGGVVGEVTNEHDTPCTCLSSGSSDNDAYRQAARSGQTDDAPVAGESAKTCRICGKDVTGQKRYKDTLGYWCIDCHKDEKKQRTAGQARCTSCGRMFPREKLLETELDRLCSTCNKERIARQREMIKSAEKKVIHRTHEKKQLYILLGIAAFLLLVILLSQLGIL